MGQVTSTLAFDISQFFSSLNHHLLSLILKKAGLDPLVVMECFGPNILFFFYLSFDFILLFLFLFLFLFLLEQ